MLLHIRNFSSHSHFFKRSPFFSSSICIIVVQYVHLLSSSNMVVKTMYTYISHRVDYIIFVFVFYRSWIRICLFHISWFFCSPGFSSSFVGIHSATSIYVYIIYLGRIILHCRIIIGFSCNLYINKRWKCNKDNSGSFRKEKEGGRE